MSCRPTAAATATVGSLLKFLDASPSPFHAVEQCLRMLEQAGFERLSEGAPRQAWRLLPNGRYFMTRNGSSLIAFTIGGQFDAAKAAVNIVAAHTDSPCLRIKPRSKLRAKDGLLQVAVETYGGGLWHTWFDRDLGVAGRVVVVGQDGRTIHERLVNIARPILRIPTLAIHLDRTPPADGFKFNTETHLCPVLASEAAESQHGTEAVASSALHASLLGEVMRSAKMEAGEGEIYGLDLCLYDVQKAALGGVHGEFVQSARLDNLFMSFAGLQALIGAAASVEKDTNVRMLCLFDNEEVGSLSSAGADSTLVAATLKRILSQLKAEDEMESILARSFLLSADMAHAAHPNYPYGRRSPRKPGREKHDECHRPSMHGGVVLKHNSSQRYTTSSRSAAHIKAIAARNAIPVQEFMVRNDSRCGTTIGPILAAQLGLQAADVGAPQLSMHSIREMAGTTDLDSSIRLFTAFYEASQAPAITTLDGLLH